MKYIDCYYPNPRTYFSIHVFSLELPQMAWLGFSPNSYAVTGNQTHVSSVATLWGTSTQDALPTKLPWWRPHLMHLPARKAVAKESVRLAAQQAWFLFPQHPKVTFYSARKNSKYKPSLLLVESQCKVWVQKISFIHSFKPRTIQVQVACIKRRFC